MLLMSFVQIAQAAPMHFDQYDNYDYWKVTPEIILCQSQSIFSKQDVEYALGVWKAKYKRITVVERCSYKTEFGKIKIVDGKFLDESHWGYTSYLYADVYRNNRSVRRFSAALVQLDRNVNNIDLLIHEMGHAFGYNHYDRQYDVMNSLKDYWSDYTYTYPY